MASLFSNELLPKTSEEALREFNERYLAGITAGPPPDWSQRFVMGVDAERVTFPISLLNTKFRETKEVQARAKKMAEESFDLRVVEYDDGYEAPLSQILKNVYQYRNWKNAPAAFVKAEARHVSYQLAKLLEAGTTTACPWDQVNFFSATHLADPKNPTGTTFSNYSSGGTDPASIDNLTTEMTAMRDVRDVNGDKLAVEPDEIWLPTAKFQVVSNLLKKELINGGESNPLLGTLKPVHVPDLTDVNDFYLVDSKLIASGIDPMLAAKYQAPETLGLREWNEDSDFFKDTGKLKVSAHIWYGFALVFPHAIRRVVGA